MRILFTNHELDHPAGTEVFLRLVIRELIARGHQIEVITSRKGMIAEELDAHGVPVHDHPLQLTGTFDVIHGQHYFETLLALVALPDTPALFFCHADPVLEWREHPVTHPRVLQWLVTCDNLKDHLHAYMRMPDAPIAVVPNPYDTKLYPSPHAISNSPKRALLFHNTMTAESPTAQAIIGACKQVHLELECIGAGFGRREPHPEREFERFDIVFAGGRSAIESIVSGCATVILGPSRIGQLACVGDADLLYASNFTRTRREFEPSIQNVAEILSLYCRESAAALTALVRQRSSHTMVVIQLEHYYKKLTAERLVSLPPDQQAMANAAAMRLAWQLIDHELTEKNRMARVLANLNNKAEQQTMEITRIRKQLDTAKNVLQRGLFRGHAWRAVQRHWQNEEQENSNTSFTQPPDQEDKL